MYRLAQKLAMLDRRWVYLAIVVVLSVPFLVRYELPIYPETYTRRFYDTVERIAQDPAQRDKIFLVLHNWGPGTSGENEPQFKVIMRHLLRPRWDEEKQEWYKLKFVFVCSIVDPVFHDTAMLAFEEAKAAERRRARRLGQPTPEWIYGVDYLDFGFKNAPVFAPFARSVVVNPREFFQIDYVNKRPLTEDSSYPLLEQYQSIDDVAAVITISAADEARDIAGLVKSQYQDLLVAPATLGIVATEMYPYVKSNQLFGLINSARGASEYRRLLDPETPNTTPLDNAMSAGKMLLLVLVVLGNVAFVVMRRGQRRGAIPRIARSSTQIMPPLPAWLMWSLFGLFIFTFGGSVIYEYVRFQQTGGPVRARQAEASAVADGAGADWERATLDEITAEARGQADDRLAAEVADLAARAEFRRLIVARVVDFCAVFCTLGVFAFLLGDNRFYRFTEAIIVGGSMAYMLIAFDKLIFEQYFANILAGVRGAAPWTNILWVALLVPSALWYFTYSKRYRWLNQLIVAFAMGMAIGPEFEKQINLVVPQILDSIRPLWPWAPFQTEIEGELVTYTAPMVRIEHFFFLVMLVLSLIYFIFSFRPRSRAGAGVLTAGRLAMMIGFGASFGNTVNTRLSWLAPRIGLLWEDWIEKLLEIDLPLG